MVLGSNLETKKGWGSISGSTRNLLGLGFSYPPVWATDCWRGVGSGGNGCVKNVWELFSLCNFSVNLKSFQNKSLFN